MLDQRDVLLLVIAAAEGKPITPVQLQKTLFLIGKANLTGIPTPLYQFEPYDYGPFDADIYRDAEELASNSLVTRGPAVHGNWTDTLVNSDGQTEAELLQKDLSDPMTQYIQDLTEWVMSLPFSSLVRTIYEKYPEYRVNSVFKG